MNSFVSFFNFLLNNNIFIGIFASLAATYIAFLVKKYRILKVFKKQKEYNIDLAKKNIAFLENIKQNIVTRKTKGSLIFVTLGDVNFSAYYHLKNNIFLYGSFSDDEIRRIDSFLGVVNLASQNEINNFLIKMRGNSNPIFAQGDVEHIDDWIKKIELAIDILEKVRL